MKSIEELNEIINTQNKIIETQKEQIQYYEKWIIEEQEKVKRWENKFDALRRILSDIQIQAKNTLDNIYKL